MLLLNQTNFIDHKVLNKEYFGTFYIRSLEVDDRSTYFLDNSFVHFQSSSSDINKFIFVKKGKLGCSVPVKSYDYKNQLHDLISFKYYILSSQKSLNNYTSSFLTSLKLLNRNLNDFKFLFLTHPNKGGFVCFSYGFLGFIPKKHCNFFLLKFLLEFKTCVKNRNFLVFYLNFLNHFKKKLSFFNVYTKFFILNVQAFYGFNKFLKLVDNKKLSLNKQLNFVENRNLAPKIPSPKKFKLNFVFLLKP